MAKKDNDNFDFETEGQAKEKSSFDLAEFFKNLTKQQKGIILAAAVGVVLVVAIVIICIVLAGNGNGNIGVNNGGTPSIGEDGKPIIPDEAKDFYISTPPTKSTYKVGDYADYSGLAVFIRGTNGQSVYIKYNERPEEFTITGFDSSEPVEEQIITVTVGENTDTFKIKIEAVQQVGVTLVGITMKSMPKLNYVVGDAFDPTGGVILAEYSDGTTVEAALDYSNVSGFSFINDTVGEHEIKIKFFDENGGYAETTITITITE